MSQIDNIYSIKAAERAVEKFNKKEISMFSSLLCQKCKILGLIPANTTDIEFAAFTSNWNPGKTGIGQECQMETLKEKYPNIQGLPNSGKNSIKLHMDGNTMLVKKFKGASNIKGVKTFDAIDDSGTDTKVFVLKTVDIGEFSVSEGGGHQDSVRDEIAILVDTAKGRNLLYNNKNVEIAIFVDGRSSDKIISHCREILGNATGIAIDKCDNL